MTNDEINKYIHEEIMGKCWHEKLPIPAGDEWMYEGCPNMSDDCVNCKKDVPLAEWRKMAPKFTDYCSDDSPRSLLNEVEKVVIDNRGQSRYLDKLCSIVINDLSEQQKAEIPGPFTAVQYTWLATTGQRVRACVEAWRSK